MSKLSRLIEMSETLPNTASFALVQTQLSAWRQSFFSLPLNRLAQNVCTARDPISASVRQDVSSLNTPGKKRHELGKTIKSSVGGPNWICAGLDLLRLSMANDCELSVAYIFYWHKLERCNYFLHTVTKLLSCCEPLEGRTFQFLMKNTVPDRGNWQMFVNLVRKYGVIPKKMYLPSWSATKTLHLNKILKSKLHEFSSKLHARFIFDGDSYKLPLMVEPMMEELYKIINICLGTPPTDFDFSFKDTEESKNFTPLSFYQQMIVPHYAIEKQVCLGHDPRLTSIYQRNYSVAYSCNMVHGLQQCYSNQPIDVILNIIVSSLSAGAAVWLVCDLQAPFSFKSEVLSLQAHNFEQVFGIHVGTTLSKADRMLYKATRRNTVMLLTGVTLDEGQQPLQFSTMRKSTDTAVNNKAIRKEEPNFSEGGEPHTETKKNAAKDAAKRKVANDKNIRLNVDWVQEYAFEIVVDARFVPPGVLHALSTQPIVELPIWDPMGSLLA